MAEFTYCGRRVTFYLFQELFLARENSEEMVDLCQIQLTMFQRLNDRDVADVRLPSMNNSIVCTAWYVTGEHLQVTVCAKYPGAACSRSTVDF